MDSAKISCSATNILETSVVKKEETKEEEDTYTRREYNYTSFHRSFTLPDEVKPEKVEANMKTGFYA